MNNKLIGLVRFYFAQSAFMVSCHFNAYNRLKKIRERNRLFVFGAAGVTLVLLVLQIIGLQISSPHLLNVLSYCGLLLTGFSLIFELYSKEDISEIMMQHKNIAEDYKISRDLYMALIEKVMSNSKDDSELRKEHDILLTKYSAIGKYAPNTTYVDYENAQKGLGIKGAKDEEFTWSDAEINKLLPSNLKLQ